MVSPYPPIDQRRAKKLVAELERLAAVFVPGLRGITTEYSPGRALVEIAGRLAGQVTQRLDKVPRRDVIAFFHTLDIPQEAPRSARVPLIFTLSDKRKKPVHAAARIQVAASTPNGEEVIFETSSALNLTPARLEYLAAVDTKEDHIEEPPPQFFQLAPIPPPTPYQMVTLANAESDTLQIAPAIELDPGDVIGIHERVYRLKETKDGLVTLHEQDRLEQAVEAGTEVRKVTRFDAFQQRNLQRHLFYVGHAELFNLEQPSTIRLGISPPAAASRLGNLGLAIEIYGTKKDGDKQPRWHRFEEENIIARVGEILLYKDWLGSVDEVEIHQQKSRWLKIELKPPIRGTQRIETRISGFALRVESGQGGAQTASGNSHWCFDGGQDPDQEEKTELCIPCEIGKQEGSQTIKQAFHNANPLPLSTRFLPFGPEPLRFDSFALAAPEALSKEGAKVALEIRLVDATPAAITMALSYSGIRRGFAIGVNGQLQVIELNDGERGIWKELGFPDNPPEGRGSDNVEMLRLDSKQALRAAEVAPGENLVVVPDIGRRHWVAHVSKIKESNIFKHPDWQLLPSLPGEAESKDFVLIPKLQSPKIQPQGAALFAVSDKGLYQLNFDSARVPDKEWKELSKPDTATFSSGQQVDTKPRLVSVHSRDWPAPPVASSLRLVLLDVEGKLWIGILTWENNSHWGSAIDWELLPNENNKWLASTEVRPVAANFGDNPGNRLAIFATKKDRALFALIWSNSNEFKYIEPSHENPPFIVEAQTELLCAPDYINSGTTKPFALAFGDTEGTNPVIALWEQDKLKPIPYPAVYGADDPKPKPSGLLVPMRDSKPPVIFISGPRENIYRSELTQESLEVDFEFFDMVSTGNRTADYLEIIGNNDQDIEVVDLKLAIEKTNFHAYALQPNEQLETDALQPNEQLETEQKFILYQKPETFRGEVLKDDNQVGEQKTRLKLDAGDKKTKKGSLLDIDNTYYEVTYIDQVGGHKIATLDNPLALGEHTYIVSHEGKVQNNDDREDQHGKLKLDNVDKDTKKGSLLTIINKGDQDIDIRHYRVAHVDRRKKVATLHAALDVGDDPKVHYTTSNRLYRNPQDVSSDQISTLLKLTNRTEVPPDSLTTILFQEGADPPAQLISQRDEQPPDSNNVWLLLGEPWDSGSIPTSNSATMLGSLNVGDWREESFSNTVQNPELSWEYYNGDGWRRLDKGFNDTTNHLAESGKICFCVPRDITPIEISGQEDYWIRARLVGGDYGRAKYVVTTTEEPPGSNVTKQSITVDTTGLRAPEIVFIEACFRMTGMVAPQLVLTENNRAVLDQTQANSATTAQFELFDGAAAIDAKLKPEEQDRALYLGFTKPYNVNPLALFIDADEPDDPDDQLETFELLFEVLELNQRWRKVAADDRTGGFQHRGVVNLFIDIVPQHARLFGRDLFWMRVRVRPGGKGDRWKPLLNGIYINAAQAEQARSVKQEILGASTGEPDQRFFLSKTPVVSNSLELRVRETLSEDERLELEQVVKVRRDSGQPDSDRAAKPVITSYPDIPGRWVLWRQVDSFVEKDSDARVYQLDPASGEVRFGNDEQGKIPPAGQDAVRAIGYQNGGGEQGNVAAFSIEGLKSSIESVDGVTNPIDAAGGVDAQDVDKLITTAPDRLRHQLQALTPVDIEALSVAWSSEIVQARCLTPDEPTGPIKVFIARRTGERCPEATRVERDALARYLREQGWGALGERSIRVFNPDYVPLCVTVEILAESPETVAALEKEARDRLLRLLHPIDGGPEGSGWPFGRGIWKSDLLHALADVPGLSRVDNIELGLDRDNVELKPKSLDSLPPSAVICADEAKVKVTVKVESGGGAA